MKMKRAPQYGLILFFLMILMSGCSNEAHMDLSKEVDSVSTVANDGIAIELQFMGKVKLGHDKSVTWDSPLKKPYIDAANKWLSVLKGVEGKLKYTIKIAVHVAELDIGNGLAGPDEEEKVGQYYFPLSGEIVIGSHTYTQGFDQVEFHANIIHEMGHVFGVGTLTNELIEYSEEYKGYVFKIDESESIKKYNQLYGVHFNALPISDDGGHLYDYIYQEDKKRILENKKTIPPMTQEVMANGTKLGIISVAILDDIGYIVDYSKATHYTP